MTTTRKQLEYIRKQQKKMDIEPCFLRYSDQLPISTANKPKLTITIPPKSMNCLRSDSDCSKEEVRNHILNNPYHTDVAFYISSIGTYEGHAICTKVNCVDCPIKRYNEKNML